MSYTGKLKKSSLYIGTDQDNSQLKAGEDGQVLSIQGDELIWRSPSSDSISLSPYIVGDTKSDFSSIQDAIDQAVLDGASINNKKNIYLKPKSIGSDSVYEENLTIPEGINILGFGNSETIYYISNPIYSNSVTIRGDIVIQGASSISSVRLQPKTSKCITINSGTLFLNNCFFDLNIDNSTAISIEGLQSKFIYLTDCIARDSTATKARLFYFDGSNISVQIDIFNLKELLLNNSLFEGESGNVLYTVRESCLRAPIIAHCATFNHYSYRNLYRLRPASLPASRLFIDENVSGSSRWSDCDFEDQFDMSPCIKCLNPNYVLQFKDCWGLSEKFNEYSPNQHISYSRYYDNDNELSRGFSINGTRVGFRGSNSIESSKTTRTLSNSNSSLIIIPLNVDEAITVKGFIVGSTDDHSQAVGGDFVFTCNRTSSSFDMIGTPVVNVMSSSTATFNCEINVGLNAVVVTAAGELDVPYNWGVTYTYQKMLNNT